MITDRTYLWLAQAFYAVSCLITVRRLRTGQRGPGGQRLNYVVMTIGFVLHTTFLYLRGQHLGRCPLTNLFETQAFAAWAAVLFFLLIGPSYRVSFLGAFTAPLVLVICLAALLSPIDVLHAQPITRSAWVEFHAAIAIVACGAFALAFVTSAMYLVQERQLKTRRLTSSFLLLPSIEQLDVINFRLLIMGFGMLTVGMIGGMVSYRIVGHWPTPKIIWAAVVWLLYGTIVLARGLWSVRGRKVALMSMASFAVMLVGFWGVNLLHP
ncbi:MAG TPA: cytochrome c biogenesis protein CcsA [Verrucomicrobiae bacterium]|nr:cytochrome c biogenesis protein CcsA [Verrucomicrobiae bacterium]